MPSNLKLFGRPNVKIRSVAAWDRLAALTYDARILITPNVANYWPLDEKAAGPDYVYDDIILQTTNLANYWPLDELAPIVYGNYDALILADGGTDYYTLDDIESV